LVILWLPEIRVAIPKKQDYQRQGIGKKLACLLVFDLFLFRCILLLVSCLLLASFTLKNPDLKQETSKKQARNKQGSECF